MKTQLTKNIDVYLSRNFNIYLDPFKKWTMEEIINTVYRQAFEKGREYKVIEIKTVLNIK